MDTTQAYRGTHSMKFSGTKMTYIVETSTFTGTTKTANNNFWGRYFILGDITATTGIPSHAVYGTMMGTDTAGATADAFHFVGGSRGKLQTQIQFASGDVFSDNEDSPAATDPEFPLQAAGWQCWEFELTSDDSYYFYIDGVEVKEMEIVKGVGTNGMKNFAPLPTVTSLQIGWLYFGTGTANSGWIDEVAIGPNRIGCGD